jgi:hypothetical protein
VDEIQAVRSLYPEPAPPTAREFAEAKALVELTPPRAPSRRRWALGAVVAVGAAAAATVALVPGGGTPGGKAPDGGTGRTSPSPVALNAMTAVLAAAHKAALQPTGRYWQVDQVQGQSYIVRGPTGAYAITGSRDETFSWWGLKPGMGEAFYDRTLAASPVTAQDTAAWRKAGSPSSFRVWAGDHWDNLTTTATTWQPNHPNPQGGGDFPGAAGVAGSQGLQGLPTDPGKLAAMFLSPKAMAKAGAPPRGSASPGAKVAITAGLLTSPLPPKVASGLIQAVASQPGVHAIGNVTDPLDRHGVALAADDQAATITSQWGTPTADQGTYRSREVLIFSPATGALLAQEEVLTKPGGPYAQESPGFVIYYLAVRSAGWTSTKPAAPAQGTAEGTSGNDG